MLRGRAVYFRYLIVDSGDDIVTYTLGAAGEKLSVTEQEWEFMTKT